MSCHSELSVTSSEGEEGGRGAATSPHSNGELLTNGEEAEMEVDEEEKETTEDEVVDMERNPVAIEKILAFGRDLQALHTRLAAGHSADTLKTLLQVIECVCVAEFVFSCGRIRSVCWPIQTLDQVLLGICWTPSRESQSVLHSTPPF